MIEDVKRDLQTAIERRIVSLLSAHEEDHGEHLDLPEPVKFYWEFHPAFTIINQYPACLILGAASKIDDVLSMSFRTNQVHELAVVFLILEQDLDKLDKKKSRYADAMVKLLKQINAGEVTTTYIKSIKPGVQVSYERTLRDEGKAVYLSSVWIMFSVEQLDTL